MITDEFRKQWVDALRSGNYEQGNGALRENGKYCCLGVACDIVPEFEWKNKSKDEEFPENWHVAFGISDYAYGSMEDSMLDHIGLSDATQDALISVNDSECLNFNQIADLIEDGDVRGFAV